jgi:hypothetical protein
MLKDVPAVSWAGPGLPSLLLLLLLLLSAALLHALMMPHSLRHGTGELG